MTVLNYLPDLPVAPPASPARRPVRDRRLTVAAILALLLLNAIVLAGVLAPLRAVVGLPVACVVPGALVLRLLRNTHRRGADWLLHAVALSLAGLFVIAGGLGVLPGLEINPVGALVALDLLIAALALADLLTKGPTTENTQPWVRPTAAATITTALGVAAVVLVVTGAHHLNAGGSPALTAAGLAVAACALAAAIAAGRRRNTGVAAGGVYLVALAVLLATSLRGIGVTGHDIKIEYRVLLDTLDGGSWYPGGTFVGYNSCLSITVLPAFLTRLLGLAAVDVFRVCFQVLFALVPVGVYLLARRRFPGGWAVAAAGLFIAFPGFVNDMPMLNRQEIALIFFVVLTGALLDAHAPRRQRQALVVIAATGLTVSHYTSTYVAATVLLIAWALRRLRKRGTTRFGRPALVLVVLAVSWAVASNSASTFGTGLYTAAAAVVDRATVSADAARYSLIGGEKPVSDAEALARYVTAIRANVPDAPPVAAACTPVLIPGDHLPPTDAGAAIARAGVTPEQLNATSRGAAVLLFEGGAVLGCALLWWRRRRTGTEALAQLTAAGLVLLAMSVVAPQLTDSYGLLRLYQQFLVLLAPLVLLGPAVAARLLLGRVTGTHRAHRVTAALAAATSVACLLTISGLIPQLVGGYVPQLNLNNAGPYYRAYYADDGDLREAAWIGRHLAPDTWLVTDSRDTANLRSMTHLYPQEGLAPGTTPAEAYVGLRVGADPDRAVAAAVVGERVLRYTFPIRCVSAGRPLVRQTPVYRVYGPVITP
ncbi:hypothetical protein GCM10010435_50210 [Winogradskya consettensis]|uniref:Glycosyltransferase RgtA/B/C/D-like domain-containing protein n=1 Tax=Winogradskya consettensis TaxID=113560 RepID=A0A919SXG2_9ACTN|nr:glycosyltransferase family 39 protein [Actinoplanes consettensis]GIM80135.1 hypothetical protein Aco04nite_69110 [Actinoplanes consettensis]